MRCVGIFLFSFLKEITKQIRGKEFLDNLCLEFFYNFSSSLTQAFWHKFSSQSQDLDFFIDNKENNAKKYPLCIFLIMQTMAINRWMDGQSKFVNRGDECKL